MESTFKTVFKHVSDKHKFRPVGIISVWLVKEGLKWRKQIQILGASVLFVMGSKARFWASG